jgi:urease accessory protein
MPWHATLDLDYSTEIGRTVARHTHIGPLRILQSLYPEGEGICHNVLVHPPGGLVGGDRLNLKVDVSAGSHGLVTTPGATRFYRSDGELALQRTHITLAENSRFEWLPLESICYSGSLAQNHLSMLLASGAELLGWDITALGLPAANKPFDTGCFSQHIEVPGVWLERAHIKAADTLLLNSPLGLAGNQCLATLFFVSGRALKRNQIQSALDVARAVIDAHPLAASAGATSPDKKVIVVRALAPLVEPAMDLLRQIRTAWRQHFWAIGPSAPRVWST